MEYVIIGICIVAAIAVGVVLYLKNKQNKEEPMNTASVESKSSSSELPVAEASNELVIQMELLPAEAIPDETKLVEITDSKVLAHVNNLVPGLAQAGNTETMLHRRLRLMERFCIELLFQQVLSSQIPKRWKVLFVVFIMGLMVSKDMLTW